MSGVQQQTKKRTRTSADGAPVVTSAAEADAAARVFTRREKGARVAQRPVVHGSADRNAATAAAGTGKAGPARATAADAPVRHASMKAESDCMVWVDNKDRAARSRAARAARMREVCVKGECRLPDLDHHPHLLTPLQLTTAARVGLLQAPCHSAHAVLLCV